ncbi:hypothetical protein [Amycolatopsis saalfeldensis]|uniref:hypothetical protein n=1 Tax=Amycolatopsis saalfeldensis TaxID=394193 RepID=UPI00116044F4|nr:hypothetical protein [Amycolatopsis saalfeldensis]
MSDMRQFNTGLLGNPALRQVLFNVALFVPWGVFARRFQPAPEEPRPVRTGRRLLGMVLDLVGVTVLGAGLVVRVRAVEYLHDPAQLTGRGEPMLDAALGTRLPAVVLLLVRQRRDCRPARGAADQCQRARREAVRLRVCGALSRGLRRLLPAVRPLNGNRPAVHAQHVVARGERALRLLHCAQG